MQARVKATASPPAIAAASLAVILMAALWILFVAGLKAHEMIVGAAATIAAGVFLLAVHKASRLDLCFHLAGLAACWRIPWYVLSDVYAITIVLFKDLLGIKEADSLYRVCGFKTSRNDPVRMARQVLATAYTTATPNSIVIGIDYTQSRMLFHQLKRSGLSRMAKSLGAQPPPSPGAKP